MTMDPAEFQDRVHTLMAGEDEPGLYWMSFIDPHRPKGQQFLGASIVEAKGPVSAVSKAHRLGCNPGGEVATWGPLSDVQIADEYLNRILTKEEAEALSNQ